MKRFYISGDQRLENGKPVPIILSEELAIQLMTALRFEYENEDELINKIKTLEVGEILINRLTLFRLKDETKNVPTGTPFDEESTTNPDKR